jgi:hypothetical protein
MRYKDPWWTSKIRYLIPVEQAYKNIIPLEVRYSRSISLADLDGMAEQAWAISKGLA